MVFSKSVLELAIWTVLSSHVFLPVQTDSSHLDYSYCLITEDNIKMDFQEVRGGCGDWMELAQDRDLWQALVNTVMNLRVPKMPGIS
jgi:hypothetical protein